MPANQSNDGTAQVGVRISTNLDKHIQQKAKSGYRSKSDELRMLIQKGFETLYGYNPEQDEATKTERLVA